MRRNLDDSIWQIGFMAWRIGNILELDDQIEWILNNGFDAIGFHSSPGVPGSWQGVEPAVTGTEKRLLLKQKLSAFKMCEIHAPFELTLKAKELGIVTEKLAEFIKFAGDLGASVLTIHADIPVYSPDILREWSKSLTNLNDLAGKAGIVIGLELMNGFEFIKEFDGNNIGVTLDVGHLYLNDGKSYRPYRTIGKLVHILQNKLLHIHLHDYNGIHDHIEIGTGYVDFDGFFRNLIEIGYRGAICLELNPDLVPPEGIKRSLEYLKAIKLKIKT